MKIIDIVARSGRTLRSAKVRTILTALAIAVGGFTLTLTLAAGNGIREYTDNLVKSNFDPAELLVGRDPEVANTTSSPSTEPKEFDEDTSNISFGGGGSNSTLAIKMTTDEDIAELEKLSYIDRVRAEYQLNSRYVTREGQKKYVANLAAYNSSQRPELVTGELPGSGDIQSGQALIPEGYLKALGFNEAKDALGQNIQVNVQESPSVNIQDLMQQFQNGSLNQPSASSLPEKTLTFKIIGVTKKSATSFSFGTLPILVSTPDAKSIYDYTAKGLPSYGKYMYVYAHVKDGENEQTIQSAKDDLKSKGYHVVGSKEIQRSITQIVDIFQYMVGVFGLITVIASVFGIINTQYISVLERTREIGLMKALGMRNRDVRWLFMIEAGWIGLLGGVLGALFAFLVGLILNPFITDKLKLGNNLLIFRPIQVVILIGALTLVAILAGYLPARKAAKLDPVEALRTE